MINAAKWSKHHVAPLANRSMKSAAWCFLFNKEKRRKLSNKEQKQIDWKKENSEAKKTGHFSKKAKRAIGAFESCYVGERLNGLFLEEAFARKMISKNNQERLEYLGLRAAHMVYNDKVPAALRIYREIQKIKVRRQCSQY